MIGFGVMPAPTPSGPTAKELFQRLDYPPALTIDLGGRDGVGVFEDGRIVYATNGALIEVVPRDGNARNVPFAILMLARVIQHVIETNRQQQLYAPYTTSRTSTGNKTSTSNSWQQWQLLYQGITTP